MAQPNLTLSEFEPPARLGRYLLGRELGRGFSSVVYEATDTLRGRKVALKVLTFLQNLSPARRQDLAERFEREARAISTLSHPAIVAIYEVGHAEDGRQYIAMEHLEGETLRARLQRGGPLLTAEALPLMVQIADALQYAHGRGIIHRDVKPDNVFVCPDGTARLMDFGVAHVFADGGMTQTGTIVGSPAYMSPEQINGRLLDGRSDVFSLAVTLVEALTGHKPFEAPNIPAVMNQILHKPPQLDGVGSRPLRKALERALAKSPQARLPSAGAFAESLRRIEPSLPDAAQTEDSPVTTMVMPLPNAVSRRHAADGWWERIGLGGAALGLAALISLPFVLKGYPTPSHSVVIARSPTAAKGRTYHISTVWHRASLGRMHHRHARHRHLVAAAPLRDGESRITEMPPSDAAAPRPTEGVLRAVRDQPTPIAAAPRHPRPAVTKERFVQPIHPAWLPQPVPVRVAAMPSPPVVDLMAPDVRISASREERRASALAPAEAARAARADWNDSQAPRAAGVPDSPPRLVHRTQPLYPSALYYQQQQGTVRLIVSVNEDGDVSDARVVRSSGDTSLDRAAVATVLHWEYEPAFHNGRAVPANVAEYVRFDQR